jgi:hypothetical protein
MTHRQSARLQTPTAHPLEVGISIRKVPADDDSVLTAADDPASVELQLEHPVAAFAVVDGSVVGVGVRLCMCLCVGEAVSLDVSVGGLQRWRMGRGRRRLYWLGGCRRMSLSLHLSV